jgi:hypothetical protein
MVSGGKSSEIVLILKIQLKVILLGWTRPDLFSFKNSKENIWTLLFSIFLEEMGNKFHSRISFPDFMPNWIGGCSEILSSGFEFLSKNNP